jgi:hypothetical protein
MSSEGRWVSAVFGRSVLVPAKIAMDVLEVGGLFLAALNTELDLGMGASLFSGPAPALVCELIVSLWVDADAPCTIEILRDVIGR